MVGDAEKLSIRVRGITDLLREANYWASESGNGAITAADVQRAIDAHIYRADRLRERPPVDILLDVDAEYRRRAEAGELKKIAPKRFNPEGETWLPIMHTERDGWNFTALYSNTARAHDLGQTHDWVLLYYERDGEEDQATVVTETHGPVEGKRVVRGREAECKRFYLQPD